MNIYIWTFLFSLLGISVGSFINVVVFRTKENNAFWKGRSKCRTCEEILSPIDMVPVFSFFALKGRCRHCSSTIAWQYPIVEMVTGILFGILFARAFLGMGFPAFVNPADWLALFVRDATISVFLLIIFIYDLKYSYILDRFSIPAIIVAILFNIGLGSDGVELLLGGLIIASFFAIQFLISNGKWIGGGDVRMGLLMGFLLGLKVGIVALFLSYIIGAFVGIFLILSKKKDIHEQVPFGTFLSIGTLTAMIFGEQILNWYLGFFG